MVHDPVVFSLFMVSTAWLVVRAYLDFRRSEENPGFLLSMRIVALSVVGLSVGGVTMIFGDPSWKWPITLFVGSFFGVFLALFVAVVTRVWFRPDEPIDLER